MSLFADLTSTYDDNIGYVGGDDRDTIPLWPMYHATYKAHVEITLDGNGNFLLAEVIDKKDSRTIIPVTESSSGRTNAPVPHPLSDKLQYVAGDFEKYGGKKGAHKLYIQQLEEWFSSPFSNLKIGAVLEYTKKGTLISDLVKHGILFIDKKGVLKTKWDGDKDNTPKIFKVITKMFDCVIRWRVEIPGELQSDLSLDKGLWESWGNFYRSTLKNKDICYATGKMDFVASQHPRKIRNDGDGTKLISSNDGKNYTFRGRFLDRNGIQACSVSDEVSQKAHNALRWLIGRKQSFRNGEQVVVTWALPGLEVPSPFSATQDIIDEFDFVEENDQRGDVQQEFSIRLSRYFAGYNQKIKGNNKVVVLGLDAASKGRLSITFYRSLHSTEYLKRAQSWHHDFAWEHTYVVDKKQKMYIGVPSPLGIVQAVYGMRVTDNLKKATIDRLLPCIIDGLNIPEDLLKELYHRATNRIGMDFWEWDKALRIYCSLYNGSLIRNNKSQRRYGMGLDSENTSRGYLYGRLLAVAEDIESIAIHAGGENNRETTAVRMMQRFASKPYSTWTSIHDALVPYRVRLKVRRAGYLVNILKLMEDILSLFEKGDFERDTVLTGDYLLGYYHQRKEFRNRKITEERSEEE